MCQIVCCIVTVLVAIVPFLDTPGRQPDSSFDREPIRRESNIVNVTKGAQRSTFIRSQPGRRNVHSSGIALKEPTLLHVSLRCACHAQETPGNGYFCPVHVMAVY
jgi:hypothetical protein